MGGGTDEVSDVAENQNGTQKQQLQNGNCNPRQVHGMDAEGLPRPSNQIQSKRSPFVFSERRSANRSPSVFMPCSAVVNCLFVVPWYRGDTKADPPLAALA
jgi:hypothetical protein